MDTPVIYVVDVQFSSPAMRRDIPIYVGMDYEIARDKALNFEFPDWSIKNSRSSCITHWKNGESWDLELMIVCGQLSQKEQKNARATT